MKQPPSMQKLEEMLRSSKLSHYGFLGEDRRALAEIIDADLADLGRLGYDTDHVARRMAELTELGAGQLGNPVTFEDRLEVCVQDYQGRIVCPWPHSANVRKRLTTLNQLATGRTLTYTDLNTHLIAEHAFFEGKGAQFRQEPALLVEFLFGG